MASDTELNASTSLVDDEGVDIVFHRRGLSRTLAVQVKSRFKGTYVLGKGTFATDVRDATFNPREDLYLLFVVVDPTEPDFGPVWLVPSRDFADRVKRNRKGLRHFAASIKETSRDQWSEYRIEKADLPARILQILGGV